MRTKIIISSTDVEKLKQKARKLRKDSGISHHDALDLVAQSAGFNHWHHVSESAKTFKPTEQAYYFGVIIAMDIKDAMDFRDPSGRFVEDPFAYALCSDDIYCCIRESAEDGDAANDERTYANDRHEWMLEEISNYVFFRYTGATLPEDVNDVVVTVRECSFWPPVFIWHKGSFQECPSDEAIDEDGQIVGIRF